MNMISTVNKMAGLVLSEDSPACDAFSYRTVIGKLMFACSTTRIDIAHAVGLLARRLEAPRELCLNAANAYENGFLCVL
ncbi:hypothetical protein WICPIJ_001537 [Wickerhamomyces pijperi]|uniref:Uncharacterized protein n=1 Tax=Wickerhamomyces pijperi TaxID=599730 RepID=A0A9P8QDE9_WICPI|nr:hypothetical protein WICPIJ_001537 [Wickerhamomyces pijperi]